MVPYVDHISMKLEEIKQYIKYKAHSKAYEMLNVI